MTETQENPSIDLSYQHIKDILESQARIWDGLDSKASTLWAIGTTVIGVGLPVLLSRTSGSSIPYIPLIWAAIACYIVATSLAVFAYMPRRIVFMHNPTFIREVFWELPREKFPLELSLHIENAHDENNKTLSLKANSVKALFASVVCETAFLISWAMLFSLR